MTNRGQTVQQKTTLAQCQCTQHMHWASAFQWQSKTDDGSPGSNTCLGARTSRLRVERAGELQLVQGTGGRESSIAMAGPPPVNAITPVHRSGGVDWKATLSEERPAENLVSE